MVTQKKIPKVYPCFFFTRSKRHNIDATILPFVGEIVEYRDRYHDSTGFTEDTIG